MDNAVWRTKGITLEQTSEKGKEGGTSVYPDCRQFLLTDRLEERASVSDLSTAVISKRLQCQKSSQTRVFLGFV